MDGLGQTRVQRQADGSCFHVLPHSGWLCGRVTRLGRPPWVAPQIKPRPVLRRDLEKTAFHREGKGKLEESFIYLK